MLTNHVWAWPHFQLLGNHFQCTRWCCSPAVLYTHLPSYMLICHLRQPSASYMHVYLPKLSCIPTCSLPYCMFICLHIHLSLYPSTFLYSYLPFYKLTLGLEGSPKVGSLGNIHKNSQNCCLRYVTPGSGRAASAPGVVPQQKQAGSRAVPWPVLPSGVTGFLCAPLKGQVG